MKKSITFYLCLIYFTTLCFATSAQYLPFIDSGKTWRELVDFGSPTGGDWFLDEFQLQGDTVINSVAYKKIEMVTSTDPEISLPLYSGALREDTSAKRVFVFFPNDTAERLLYDFNLAVGEQHTFHNCFGAAPIGAEAQSFNVDSIGSYIDGAGLMRKVWYLNYSQFGVVSKIIEGVGSNTGLLSYSCHFDMWTDLVCAHKDSVVLFVNESPLSYYCTPFFNVGIAEHESDFDFSLYPNPSNSTINIEHENIASITAMNIFAVDQLGRVHELNAKNELNKITVDVSNLSNGVYALHIDTDLGQRVKKFIVEK